MKRAAVAIALAMLVSPAAAASFTSDYTRVDQQNDCHVMARAADGEGNWADLVCPGYGHYPYVLSYDDGRETVTYGFASSGAMPGFAPFNYANDTIEWRLVTENGATRPVAAIQRWFLANPEGEWQTQILVVSKVGQPDGSGEACVIGYISAADGAAANERARALADRALDLECGSEIAVEEAVQEFAPRP